MVIYDIIHEYVLWRTGIQQGRAGVAQLSPEF